MRHSCLKRLMSLVLVAAMLLSGTALAAAGTGSAQSAGLTYEKLDQDSVSVQLANTDHQVEEPQSASFYADTDMVRVTIVLNEAAAISLMDAGVETAAAESAEIASYRQGLERQQRRVAAEISSQVLEGEELDVVWNLTLVTNAISANVEYGKMKEIAALDSVSAVYLETRYEPLSQAGTNNIVAQEMTGASGVQQSAGYTGAGTRIAVIDTGTDTDHQSFSEEGYLYSLSQAAKQKGMSAEAYIASLDLLTVEEIAGVLPQLHAAERYQGLTADQLYESAKLPFNFNYVDHDLDVTHDNDSQGEHGSHVAGISTANSYIKSDIDARTAYDFDGDGDLDRDDAQALMNHVVKGAAIACIGYADISGNGTVTSYDVYLLLKILDNGGEVFDSAAATVGVTGVAPDAQLITMKVFGKNGGAYTSDYMAAVEDAILLGCDVANLSLGAPYAGFAMAHDDGETDIAYVNGLMEKIAGTGLVLCVAAGNSGNWADNDEAYQLMYADEAGTYNISEPATYANALAVASVDNVGSVSLSKTLFASAGGAGAVELGLETVGDGVDEPWESLDPNGAGTVYEAVFLGDPSQLFAGGEQEDLTIYGGEMADFAGYDFTGKIVLIARGNMVNFSLKHTNAALAGAAAVVIYNNVPGSLSASILGSEATIPCMGMSMEDAETFFALCGENGGVYTGSVTVTSGLNVDHGEDVTYPTMSDFSSWGSTGALTIKPEITAPGGAIYSVNGGVSATDQYEPMSGTSMATPHVSGLVALASQYIRENGLAEKAGVSARVLAQSLLMSTAVPLTEESSGVEYSVRNQGAGLANVQNVVNAESFILVDGQSDGKVKAELGDGTAPWSFTFTIRNLTDSSLTYALDASILTTGTTAVDGNALSTDEMTALDALVSFSTGSTVTVPAGGSADVTATVAVSDSAAAAMREKGYTNGFYVEGYVYAEAVATAEGVSGVTHSIPLLGWYGNWSDPSMYDTGSYVDYAYGTLQRPSHINSAIKNVLTWCPTGYDRGFYYDGNIYNGALDGDSRYIEARNAFNSTASAWWELYAIFPTLIRNAADFKVQVTDSDTGEIYYLDDYETYDDTMIASFYYASYGQWYDTTSEYGVGLVDWGFTDQQGNPLPEGTNVTISLVCVPDYFVKDGRVEDWSEIGEGAYLSYRFTVDNTAPDLVENGLSYADGQLRFTVQDNNYVAAVALLNGSATEAVTYYYPDMDENQRGEAVSGSFDLSGFSGRKVAVAICDYAGNTTYYAINLGGAGASYGELVGFQYDPDELANCWVSFSEGVDGDETGLFASDRKFVCAEYVNGYVFAQDEYGALYGIPYEDMLADTVDLEATYITRLENAYQDLAYSYAEGKLYGLLTSEDPWDGSVSEIYSINLKGEYYDPDLWTTVKAYQEDWAASRGGLFGLTLACDDNGSLYILGTSVDEETGEESTAQLWKASMETEWGYTYLGAFKLVGDTGEEMNYLQSMTWDHNTETLYWTQFYPENFYTLRANLQKIDPETAECTQVGTLSNETAGLFAPLTAESAARAEHANVPDMDADTVGRPIVSPTVLTLNKGGSYALSYVLDPWYTSHKDVVWSSDDPDVAAVDEDGVVTAMGNGACTITVAARDDESLNSTCAVTVASLDLSIEGIISAQGAGIGNVSGVGMYEYGMEAGESSITMGQLVTYPEEFSGFGTSLGASAYGPDGSIWACEYGNSGMIYQIDGETGEVLDMLQPIDGDMMFGLDYSEATGMFTGIMNFYLYVDLPMTHEAEQEMLGSLEEGAYQYTWHKLDLSQYLSASDEGFNTGETGNGSMVDVVLCGVTSLDNTDGTSVYAYLDYLGGYGGGEATYTPTTTLVLLDNVGRLWYVDEITGLTAEEDYWSGSMNYFSEDGSSYIPGSFNGVMALENSDGTYNVFFIRELVETPLTDMYWAGTMPRITYHFSDICATRTENGDPAFFLSLYDYWNGGITNQLYLYVPGVGTGEYTFDENWNYVEIKTPDSLYDLGDTGEHNIIATINYAEVTGGLNQSADNGNDGQDADVHPYVGFYDPKRQ